MQNHLQQKLARHFPHQTDFLIGLSGGVDSVVLLHLFCKLCNQLPLNLRAAHIHHGLSPNAESWALFCEELCEKLHIPLVVKQVKVEGSQGIEANARSARYQAIQNIIQPNEIFCTAHHLDDQAETFFLALKRGAGLKGLSAMQVVSYWQNFTIFRPLLAFSKTEITRYAEEHQLGWINDESNADNTFERNFLRNDVLPLLNQRWKQFNQMVARASEQCAEQQLLIEELLADEINQRINLDRQSLNIEGFSQFSQGKQKQIIRLWLEKCNVLMPSQVQLDQLLQTVVFAEQDKNPQLKLGDKVVRRYQHCLFLVEEKEADSSTPNIPISTLLPPQARTELTVFATQISRSSDALIYKKSGKSYRLPLPQELQNQPLTIKNQQSSKVKLYGKPYREEMKKIWQKNSVPVWKRNSTPLVFFDDQLVTVLYAADDIEK